MPRLGYGSDKLNWREVRRMIFYIFEDLNMDILIGSLPEKENMSSIEEVTVHKCEQVNEMEKIQVIQHTSEVGRFFVKKDQTVERDQEVEVEVIWKEASRVKTWWRHIQLNENFLVKKGLLCTDLPEHPNKPIITLKNLRATCRLPKCTTLGWLVKIESPPPQVCTLCTVNEQERVTLQDHNLDHTKYPEFKKRLSRLLEECSDVFCKSTRYMNGQEYLLAIPNHLVREILETSYADPLSGHLGITKTLQRIKDRFYWTKLQKDVKKYVKGCPHCQPIPVGLPFDKVGIDILGPFGKSVNGNTVRVVATDYATTWAEMRALPNVHHSVSHPSRNGLTKRLNKTIADMLALYVNSQQTDWCSFVPLVKFAYNTAKQETTKYSPFMLEPILPTEASLLQDIKTTDAIQIRDRTLAVRQLAAENIKKKQVIDKYRYDAKRRPGDKVKVFTPVRKVGKSEKLLNKWFEPYIIVRKLGNVDCEV
nr:unnamed protein product [Callosobruchus analis]